MSKKSNVIYSISKEDVEETLDIRQKPKSVTPTKQQPVEIQQLKQQQFFVQNQAVQNQFAGAGFQVQQIMQNAVQHGNQQIQYGGRTKSPKYQKKRAPVKPTFTPEQQEEILSKCTRIQQSELQNLKYGQLIRYQTFDGDGNCDLKYGGKFINFDEKSGMIIIQNVKSKENYRIQVDGSKIFYLQKSQQQEMQQLRDENIQLRNQIAILAQHIQNLEAKLAKQK